MKKFGFINLFLVLALFHVNAANAGKLELIENAIEAEQLEIKISNDLTGIVRGKTCDRCEVIVVKITPQTRLFVKGKQVELSKAAERSGKPGTAVFNIKTQLVTKIYSY